MFHQHSLDHLGPFLILGESLTPERRTVPLVVHDPEDGHGAANAFRVNLDQLDTLHGNRQEIHLRPNKIGVILEVEQTDAAEHDIDSRPIVLPEEALNEPVEIARNDRVLEDFVGHLALFLHL